MIPSYLEFTTLPGRPTVHDNLTPDTTAVYPVRFKDGNIGLLPLAQIHALDMLIEYNWDTELMSWNQSCNDDFWNDEPFVTDEDDHIIHHLAALRMKEDT